MQDGKVQYIPKFRLKDFRKLITGDVHIQDRRRLLTFALFVTLKHLRKLPHSSFLLPEYCMEHLSVLKTSVMFVYIDQKFLFHLRYPDSLFMFENINAHFMNNCLD